MPEGDTLFRAARALGKALTGKTVTRFETALAPLARVDDDTPIAGRTIENIEARGKWLLMHFSGDLILVTHMLMSGSWHIYRMGERWRARRSGMRLVLEVEGWQAVAFNVPVAEFHTSASLLRKSSVPKLGPDVLGANYTADTGADALRARARSHPEDEIANVLLNQRVLAGLGNVYKSEVCFAARVHPFRAMSTLSEAELLQMADVSQRYMRANVQDGSGDGIVTYTGNRRTTHSMDREERLWVYGRQGKECRRCGGVIEMRKQGPGARSTYWCPSCQPWIAAENGTAPIAEPHGRSNPVRRRRASC